MPTWLEQVVQKFFLQSKQVCSITLGHHPGPGAGNFSPGVKSFLSAPPSIHPPHEATSATFLDMLAKWAPQALQLGSEPVGEGKELYPGLE